MGVGRFIVVVGLLSIAVLLGVRGTQVLPEFVVGFTSQAGGDLQTLARIGTGLSIALAGTILVLGSRGYILAIICASALAFIGIADVAAVLASSTKGNLTQPIVEVVLGGVLLYVLVRLRAKASAAETSPPPLGHPGAQTLGVVVAVVVGAVVSANVIPPETHRTQESNGPYTVVEFSLADWPGQSLEETGLLKYLPALPALTTIGGPTVLAFYTPHCDHCHGFFAEEFDRRRDAQIIAIKVPAAKGVEPADPSLGEDVVCSRCTMLTLPKGPVWLIQAPLIVTIIDGRIACVAQHDDPDRQRACIRETEQSALDAARANELPPEEVSP